MSDRREADWDTVPDLHLVTSKTTFSSSGSVLRTRDRALGATPSYPGHDATNELSHSITSSNIRMQHNDVTLITGHFGCQLSYA